MGAKKRARKMVRWLESHPDSGVAAKALVDCLVAVRDMKMVVRIQDILLRKQELQEMDRRAWERQERYYDRIKRGRSECGWDSTMIGPRSYCTFEDTVEAKLTAWVRRETSELRRDRRAARRAARVI